MIEYVEGDIFISPAQVIVNTVNTVGVMGKGLALEYKKRYPDMFKAYRTACEKKQLKVGKLMLFYAPDHWILLFPTKENWRNPSKLEYIEAGLMKFRNKYADLNITSIAFPRLGCGNGELKWDDVRPLMEKYLKPLPISVYIYIGKTENDSPEHKAQQETMNWLRGNAKDMSFNGVKDDIINQNVLLPISLLSGSVSLTVMWKDGLIFKCADEKKDVFVSEDDFFKFWDSIRNDIIFPVNRISEQELLICTMLAALGYLSPIRIEDSKTHEMLDGYQLNESSGRLFALKEDV